MIDRILFVSHSADGGTFKVGSHHLAREMALLGADVAHVCTPWSLVHGALRRVSGGRQELAERGPYRDDSGVLHGCPRTVLPSRLSDGRYLQDFLAQIGFENPDLVLIDQPLMNSRYLHSLGSLRIYRPTDLYLRGSASKCQSRLLPHVHGVIATSQPVLESLSLATHQKSIVVENGVEYSRFSHAATRSRSGAAYVGAVDERFDWQAVIQFAVSAPEETFRIAGPVTTTLPSGLPPNVILMGPVPYRESATILMESRVGLMPFSGDWRNDGRSPMKLFEYLAAGLYVVAKRREHRPIGLPGMLEYDAAADAIAQLRHWLNSRSANIEGSKRAQKEDWLAKASSILEFAKRL